MNMDGFDYHTFFDDVESLETLSNNTVWILLFFLIKNYFDFINRHHQQQRKTIPIVGLHTHHQWMAEWIIQLSISVSKSE
jgi:hypothetical protein